jgi:hypothetical protein
MFGYTLFTVSLFEFSDVVPMLNILNAQYREYMSPFVIVAGVAQLLTALGGLGIEGLKFLVRVR